MMTEVRTDEYTMAGWLAVISGVLLIPETGLAVLAELLSPVYKTALIPIHIVNVVIGVYILYMFRRLLNRQFDFRSVDTIITLLIVANVLFFFLGLAELLFVVLDLTLEAALGFSIVGVVLFVPYGLLTIGFGVLLLRLRDDLFGLLKPFAYLTVASGICAATVILMPLGLLAAAVALVMQGMIFLRAKREAELL